MPFDIDLAAIAIMESLGVISFLVAFLFFRQLQRMVHKQRAFLDALNRRLISERGNGKCYSSEWVLNNIVYRRRRILNATPLVFTIVMFLLAIFLYLAVPLLLTNIVSLGYAIVIALVGIAILFWTDAFQAYSYVNAIHRVATEKLDREDQSYIEIAKEAAEKAFLRFTSLGVAFALLGPFVPQIFNGVVSVFLMYTTVYFQASEATFKVLAIFGAIIVLFLSALMLFLPEFLGRAIIRKGKSLVRRIFKRRVEH